MNLCSKWNIRVTSTGYILPPGQAKDRLALPLEIMLDPAMGRASLCHRLSSQPHGTDDMHTEVLHKGKCGALLMIQTKLYNSEVKFLAKKKKKKKKKKKR